jgi:hypothetical protein
MMYSKVCPICGNPFETKTKKKIFCSPKCAKRNDYIKYGKAACTRFSKNHPERMKVAQEKYNLTHPNHWKPMRQKIRLEAMKHISDEIKCCRCGFSEFPALQIDHINGGGRKETKEIENGYHVYQVKYWRYILALPKDEARKRYQLLCANCNILKLFKENEFIKR